MGMLKYIGHFGEQRWLRCAELSLPKSVRSSVLETGQLQRMPSMSVPAQSTFAMAQASYRTYAVSPYLQAQVISSIAEAVSDISWSLRTLDFDQNHAGSTNSFGDDQLQVLLYTLPVIYPH